MSYTRMTTLHVFVSIRSRIIEQINNKYCLSIYFLFLKKGGNSPETSVSNRNKENISGDDMLFNNIENVKNE